MSKIFLVSLTASSWEDFEKQSIASFTHREDAEGCKRILNNVIQAKSFTEAEPDLEQLKDRFGVKWYESEEANDALRMLAGQTGIPEDSRHNFQVLIEEVPLDA